MDHILDNNITTMLNFLGSCNITVVMEVNLPVLVPGRSMLKYMGAKCHDVHNLISRLKHVAVHCFTNFSVGLKFSKIKVYINNLGWWWEA